jgi:hypothetical protein
MLFLLFSHDFPPCRVAAELPLLIIDVIPDYPLFPPSLTPTPVLIISSNIVQ